jgi:cholesterol oxidase
MDAHETFETVHVGVNLEGSEKESDPYFNGLGPLRRRCTECGGCMVGCRENAKNTLDMNYLWFAEKLGLELVPETKVEKIIFKDNLYHIESKHITSFHRNSKKTFT